MIIGTSPEPRIVLLRRGWIVQSLPFVLALTAFVLSASALWSCQFLVAEIGEAPRAAGIFRISAGAGNQICTTWQHLLELDEDSVSTQVKVAQAFGILACLFGFASLALIFSGFFSARALAQPVARIVLPVLLAAAAISQLATFAAFGDERCGGSEVTCTFAEGANQALAAAVLYLFLAVATIFFPRRSVPLCVIADGDDVETATNGFPGTTYEKVPACEVMMSEQSYNQPTPTPNTVPRGEVPSMDPADDYMSKARDDDERMRPPVPHRPSPRRQQGADAFAGTASPHGDARGGRHQDRATRPRQTMPHHLVGYDDDDDAAARAPPSSSAAGGRRPVRGGGEGEKAKSPPPADDRSPSRQSVASLFHEDAGRGAMAADDSGASSKRGGGNGSSSSLMADDPGFYQDGSRERRNNNNSSNNNRKSNKHRKHRSERRLEQRREEKRREETDQRDGDAHVDYRNHDRGNVFYDEE